jgi:membrane protein implicated in regulation of membrane protease activity
MLTTGFFLAPFAVGALLAAVAALIGAGTATQAIIFVAIALLMLAFLRPLLASRMTSAPALRTGAAALIGQNAVVLERIVNHEAVGCVRIDGGEIWTARSLDDDEVLEPGMHVQVVEIKGATAIVAE